MDLLKEAGENATIVRVDKNPSKRELSFILYTVDDKGDKMTLNEKKRLIVLLCAVVLGLSMAIAMN
jgi:hypothetical protein